MGRDGSKGEGNLKKPKHSVNFLFGGKNSLGRLEALKLRQGKSLCDGCVSELEVVTSRMFHFKYLLAESQKKNLKYKTIVKGYIRKYGRLDKEDYK